MSATTLSYVSGTSNEPLLYKTVGGLLEDAAARWPERDAIVLNQQGIRWSYRRFNDEADRFAAGLIKLGLEPGDRVGIWAPNRYEWLVTQFATAKAGLILVNINPAYRVSELEFVLNKVGCKALVLAPSFKTNDYIGALRHIAPEIDSSTPGRWSCARLPLLRAAIQMGGYTRPWVPLVPRHREFGDRRGARSAH